MTQGCNDDDRDRPSSQAREHASHRRRVPPLAALTSWDIAFVQLFGDSPQREPSSPQTLDAAYHRLWPLRRSQALSCLRGGGAYRAPPRARAWRLRTLGRHDNLASVGLRSGAVYDFAVSRDLVGLVGGDGVAAGAAVDRVRRVVAGVDQILSGAPGDRVAPGAAGDRVVAAAAVQLGSTEPPLSRSSWLRRRFTKRR